MSSDSLEYQNNSLRSEDWKINFSGAPLTRWSLWEMQHKLITRFIFTNGNPQCKKIAKVVILDCACLITQPITDILYCLTPTVCTRHVTIYTLYGDWKAVYNLCFMTFFMKISIRLWNINTISKSSFRDIVCVFFSAYL